jgi:hypothetical protein
MAVPFGCRASSPSRHLLETVAGDLKRTGLFSANPGGIPGHIHCRDPLVPVHAVSTGVRNHGVEKTHAILIRSWSLPAFSGDHHCHAPQARRGCSPKETCPLGIRVRPRLDTRARRTRVSKYPQLERDHLPCRVVPTAKPEPALRTISA